MKILSCGYDFPHKTGEFCAKKISSYYFISCFSTPFVYETENRLQFGNAWDLLITPPGCVIYHGPQSDEEAFVNDWIYVDGEDFADLLSQYPLPENQAFHIENTSQLKSCIQKIQKELLLKQDGYEKIISSSLTETIIHIYRLYHRQYHLDASSSRIASAREMILRNLEKDWTLQEMAELSGYSVSRFSSLYVQNFGLSPKADLIHNRIQLAKQLLNYSELSITEIAAQCGFQSIYYFSKYFKAAVGMSPSEYARQWGA